MNCNIRRDVRVCFTKLRLSSHKFLVERARWLKVKVPYTQRTCTLCNSNDIEDEYHVTLVCEYFRDVRKKYIKPFYYQRPNMMKFLDLMTSVSKKDRFRLMLFLKVVFLNVCRNTMTYNNYSHFTNLISFSNVLFECIMKSITIIKLFLKQQYLLLNITIYF